MRLEINWQQLDLRCFYAGLPLRSPLIVASSPLSDSPAKVAQLAEAGAGAVVLRSLFEEDADKVSQSSLLDQSVGKHTEAYDYIREMAKIVEPNQYMDDLAELSRQTQIPIIASLNGTDPDWWQDCAFGLERAGASAIELNLGMLQLQLGWTYRDEQRTEKKFLKALRKTAAELNIPLCLKVPPYMANSLPQLCRIAKSGVRGLVYFNRYCLPDIDLDTLEFIAGPRLSQPIEFHQPLRYLALHAPLFQQVADQGGEANGCDLALSGGIYSGTQIAKALLLGASAIQVCSVLLQNGPEYIGTLLNELAQWMRQQKLFSLAQLHGQYHLKDRPKLLAQFQRLQYLQTLP